MSRKSKPYPEGRDKYLQDTYGITEKQFEKMFKRQKGKCPIDDQKIYGYHEKQGRRASPVDHDHKTGRVRGIICYTCNRFRVGRNTAETARHVLEYLDSDFDGRNI